MTNHCLNPRWEKYPHLIFDYGLNKITSDEGRYREKKAMKFIIITHIYVMQ